MMAGLAAGFGKWGRPLGDVYNRVPEPQSQQPGIETAPTKFKREFAFNSGDRNAPRPNFAYQGMLQNMGIFPRVGDPFRTYGSVEGGRVIPPANPFAEPPGLNYTPAGTWEGGGPGPINTGPSNIPWFQPPTGGFTGGQIPPDMQSGSSPMSTMKPGVTPRDRTAPYMPTITRGGQIGGGGGMPPSRIPGRPQQRPFGGRNIGGRSRGMFR